MEIRVGSELEGLENEDQYELDSTMLQVVTDQHPIENIRNVDWEDPALNCYAKSWGFPNLVTLSESKRRNVTSVEMNDSGAGPEGQGWAVRWPLSLEDWDREQKLTLGDLPYHLETRHTEVRVDDRNQILHPELLPHSPPNFSLEAGSPQWMEPISGVAAAESSLETNTIHFPQPFHHEYWNPTAVSPSIPLLFDAVMISRLPPGVKTQALRNMPMNQITAIPSFCFLWVEDITEMELCGEILKAWGFRVAEDIVIYDASIFRSKTDDKRDGGDIQGRPTSGGDTGCDGCEPGNLTVAELLLSLGLEEEDDRNFVSPAHFCANSRSSEFSTNQRDSISPHTDTVLSLDPPANVFRRTARHCLMGVKGTVKRSTDDATIHCNIDSDVLLCKDSRATEDEILELIESFTLGRRRLHLFGDDGSRRRGWLTMGLDISKTTLDAQTWLNGMQDGYLVRTTTAIENLRPKSPSSGSFEGRISVTSSQ